MTGQDCRLLITGIVFYGDFMANMAMLEGLQSVDDAKGVDIYLKTDSLAVERMISWEDEDFTEIFWLAEEIRALRSEKNVAMANPKNIP